MKNRFSKVLGYLKPFIGLSVLSTLISLVVSASNAAPAWFVQYIIDDVLVSKNKKMLALICIAVPVITFLKGIASYYRQYIQSYISTKMTKNLRDALYKRMIYLSHNFFSKTKTGDILTRFLSDLDMIQNILRTAFNSIVQILTIFILLGRLFFLDWKLTLVCLIAIPLSSNFVKKYIKRLRRTGKEIQESIADLNSLLQEIVNGINVIKSFATEEYEMERFEEKSHINYRATLKNRKIDARLKPLVEFFNTLSMVAVIYYGGVLVIKGNITPGELMSFLTALGLLYTPIKTLTNYISDMQTRLPSIDRVYDIFESDEEIVENKGAVNLKKVIGNIKIENLSFKYSKESEKVLENINLEAKPGEMVALVGKSGSGKSTLVRLLPRFYDLTNGRIEIDNKNIKDIKLNSLRKNIGIVPQETFLFSGTIYDNISYGTKKVKKEAVIKAAKMANAYKFIMDFPDGFDTEIGEKGVRLSGGQKQRIAIARALLENPPILILDEATSALDTESEKLVQDALDKLMKDRTSFVIAHRLTTILHADKIVVMEDGKIVEMGTNKELLQKNGAYKKLYDTQFGKIESGE